MQRDFDTILAIDPGTATIGWAVLLAKGDRVRLADCGAITTPKEHDPGQRLKAIHVQVSELMEKWRPEVLAVERLFFSRNVTTATHVGQAVGVILLAAAECSIPVVEYTPPQVKLAVVGEGRAEKRQVQYMVARLLNLPEPPRPDDVADAVAIAICHANSRRLRTLTDSGQT